MITCVLCGATTAEGVEYCPRHGCGAALAVQDLYARHAVQIGFGVPPLVRLVPGDVLTLPLRIRNAGREAGQFTVHAVDFSADLGAGWAAIETSQIRLDPGMLGSAHLRLRAPRGSTSTPGRRAVTVEVASSTEPGVRARADLRVDVLPFTAFDQHVVPALLRPRRTASATLTIVNTGTAELCPEIDAGSDTAMIAVDCPAAGDAIPPGGAARLPVRVRVRRRRWFRRPAPRMVEIVVRSGDVERVAVARVEALARTALRPPWGRPPTETDSEMTVALGIAGADGRGRAPGAHQRGGIANVLLLRGVPRGLAATCVVLAFVLSGLLTAHYDGLLGGGSSGSGADGPAGGSGARVFVAPTDPPTTHTGQATTRPGTTTASPTGSPRTTSGGPTPVLAGASGPPGSGNSPNVVQGLDGVTTGAAPLIGPVTSDPPPVEPVLPASANVPLPTADAGPIQIPSVRGDTQQGAEAALRNKGFTGPVSFVQQSSSTVPSGSATGTSPPAGDVAAPSTPITVYLSTGPAPASTTFAG